MPDPWKPEREWSIDEVREVVRAQSPAIESATVEHVGSGWDNAAFLIDGQWIFRFAQRRIAVPLLEQEWNVLPQLASRMPVPIPDPKWFGQVDEWAFLGYAMLKGCPVSELALDQQARLELARPWAGFCALHEQPINDYTARPDPLGRFDIEPRRSRTLGLLADCNPPVDAAVLRRLLEEVDPTPGEIVLSHGDLYSRHLLIDKGKLSGVIDWGDVCLADRAHDLMLPFTFLPMEARREFFAEYGRISDSTASRARFRAIDHTIHVYRYAKSVGDVPLLNEAMTSFQSVIASIS